VEEDAQPLTGFPDYGPPESCGIWGRKLIFAGNFSDEGRNYFYQRRNKILKGTMNQM
jgi:hypothetical protein